MKLACHTSWILVFAVLTLTACHNPCSCEVQVDNSETRKEQVQENLLSAFTQFQKFQPQMGDFKRVTIDQVVLTLNTQRGPEAHTLFVTPDNKMLYFTTGGVIDVSRSVEEVRNFFQQQQP